MGAWFSCRSSPPVEIESIRVVHLNGYVEDFDQPVSVSQVTGNPPKHFVCTPAQLLSSTNGSKPLKPETQLEPGKIYFVLPYTAFQAEVSPLDLASMVKRLNTVAKNSRYEAKSPRASPLLNQYGSSPVGNSPARSPNRFAEPEASTGAHGAKSSSRARSWRPLLDTITERSFNRRSESDLLEKHSETPK